MKILLIHTSEFPKNTPGNKRISSLLSRLAENHDVTILAVAGDTGELNSNDVGFTSNLVRLPIAFYNKHYLRVVNKIRKLSPSLDYYLSFGWVLLSAISKCNHKYDMIISSYQPIGSVITAKKAAKLLGARWVCDLRDLPNQHLPYREMNKESVFLKTLLKDADGVTVTTPMLEKRLVNEYSIVGSKVIYNGIEFSKLMPSNRVNIDTLDIIYAGSLYGGRDLSPVLKGLDLLDERGVDLSMIRLRVFGNILGATREFYTSKFDFKIRFEGMVSQEELYTAYSQASLLINCLPEQHKDAIPSKIFEYLALDIPIINLSPGSEFLDCLFTENSIGITTLSPEVCANYIQNRLNDFLTGNKIQVERSNKVFLLDYTREKQADEFTKYLEEIAASSQN